jgi:hypothetical protein
VAEFEFSDDGSSVPRIVRGVWVIGTSHDYQLLRRGSDQLGVAQFRALLTTVATDHGVRAIAEEMSLEGLALHKADDSVCKQVARTLGIPHRFCDPSSQERKALGIAEDDDIRMSGFFAGRDQQAIECYVRASYSLRERSWLGQLIELDAWPLLFVCGAYHAESFCARLQAEAIDVRLLFTNWSPNY